MRRSQKLVGRVRAAALALGVVGLLGALGCQESGSYQLSWTFEDGDAASRCGLHGVDAVRITGASGGGDGENVVALCTTGTIVRSVNPGSWAFAVHSVDIQGQLVCPLTSPDDRTDKGDAPPPIVIKNGQLTVVMPPLVLLSSRSECQGQAGDPAVVDGGVD